MGKCDWLKDKKELRSIVQMSSVTQLPIFTRNPYTSDRLDEVAEEMGLKIPEPIMELDPNHEEKLNGIEYLKDGTTEKGSF